MSSPALGPAVRLADVPARPLAPERWTVIVPAAGRGSRLGASVPKVLFPLLGRPILDWLLDALDGLCGRTILVVGPDGGAAADHLRARLGDEARSVVQERLTGMADAVLLAEPLVETSNVLLVWGDQALVRRRTLRACMALHDRPGARLTLPTVVRAAPYIALERDPGGRITAVKQAREGEVRVDQGESDCGVFLFSSTALFDALRAARGEGGRGRATGEFNLLPLLPRFEQGPGSVATIRLDDALETLGVNTPEEAAAAERELAARRGREPE